MGAVCLEGHCTNQHCVGVVCPSGTQCADGRCAQDDCPTLTCASGEVCEGAECVSASCVGLSCPQDQRCELAACVAQAAADAGEAGEDAGESADAAAPAGKDAGTVDAGLDAGIAGIDAGVDAGLDAGVDAGLDAGIDAGLDAGIDAGTCSACSNVACQDGCGNACNEGGSCDSNKCNGTSACNAGTCTHGAPVACTSPPACHTATGATCVSATGACSYPSLVADGTACAGGVCVSGACAPCQTTAMRVPGAVSSATTVLSPGAQHGWQADGSSSVLNGIRVAGDGGAARTDFQAKTYSRALDATSFGFSVPTGAWIKGIEVDAHPKAGDSPSHIQDATVRILQGGSPIGSDHSGGSLWPAQAYAARMYGTSSDRWGASWSATTVNAAGFGVRLVGYNNSASQTPSGWIDYVGIRVTYCK
jgi:hypothetical protein